MEIFIDMRRSLKRDGKKSIFLLLLSTLSVHTQITIDSSSHSQSAVNVDVMKNCMNEEEEILPFIVQIHSTSFFFIIHLFMQIRKVHQWKILG